MNSIIHCEPAGYFSFNQTVYTDEHKALIHFDIFGGSGTIKIEGKEYRTAKDGFIPAAWSFHHKGRKIFTARKTRILSREIMIQEGSKQYKLSTAALFGYDMNLTGPSHSLAISRIHIFSRKIKITGDWSNFPLICFALSLRNL